MLARWGLVYVLIVLSLFLGGVAAWQRQMTVAANDRHKIALEKFEALESEMRSLRVEATNAARQAAEINTQFERQKREIDAKSPKTAMSQETLNKALAEKLAAETMRDEAEARLASEAQAKANSEKALTEAQAEAERLRSSVEAAARDAETARAELAKLIGERTRETGSISPGPPPQSQPATETPAAVTTAVPATKLDTPSPSDAKTQAPAKPAVKPVAAKPRPKPKPKPESSFFDN